MTLEQSLIWCKTWNWRLKITFHVYLHKIWEYFGHGPPNCTNVLIRTKQVQKTHMILTQEENLIWYEIRSRRLWITFSVTTQKRKLRIWSYLLVKSLMENFIFGAVCVLAHDLGNLGPVFHNETDIQILVRQIWLYQQRVSTLE